MENSARYRVKETKDKNKKDIYIISEEHFIKFL